MLKHITPHLNYHQSRIIYISSHCVIMHTNEFEAFRRAVTEPNALPIRWQHCQHDNTSYLCIIHMTTCDFDVARRVQPFLLQDLYRSNKCIINIWNQFHMDRWTLTVVIWFEKNDRFIDITRTALS